MMVRTGMASMLADLLGILLQENRGLLQELKAERVVERLKAETGALDGLAVGPDLALELTDLDDAPETVMALGSLVLTLRDYMGMFVGEEEASSRFESALRLFGAKYLDSEVAPLRKRFPEIFRADAGGDVGQEEGDDLDRLRELFLGIFASAVRTPDEARTLGGLLRACSTISTVSDDLSWFEFHPGVETRQAVEELVGAVESARLNPARIEEALDAHSGAAADLGVTGMMFGGVFSGSARFGSGPVDMLFRDGLRNDHTLVLKGPAGAEKEMLALRFLAQGLDTGGCGIVVTSRYPPEQVERTLAAMGSAPSGGDGSPLVFVDWYARYRERIASIEEREGMILVSNDLTNLAVGIDMALKRASSFPHRRLVLDLASLTMLTEGFERTHDFLASVRGKLKGMKCTGLVLLNPDMHTQEQVRTIEDMFDGVLAVERTEKDGQVLAGLRVESLSGAAFDQAGIQVKMHDRGMTLSHPAGGAEETILFDHGDDRESLGMPGIEAITAGGLPLGRSYLVRMASALPQETFMRAVLQEAQRSGQGVLLALSTLPPDMVESIVREQGLSSKGLMDRGLLRVVDWRGQEEKVLGVETRGGLILTSQDITHLGVGLDKALGGMDPNVPAVALLEVLSPAIRMFDTATVLPFVQSVNAKLSARGFTGFMLMEREAHDPGTVAAMEEAFDGILDIRSTPRGLELGVISIRGAHFQPEYRPLSTARGRLAVDVARHVTDREIVSSMEEQGLAARLRQMEEELAAARREKEALEGRMKEMARREMEFEARHMEMRDAMAELEAKLKSASPGVAPGHREELKRLLAIMDDMLENLPPEVIEAFARSEDFKLYERIMDIYLKEDEE